MLFFILFLTSNIIILYSRIDIINKNNNSKDKTINEYINDFITMNNISRELIVNLIQKIEIYKDKRINIVLTFSKDYVL